MAVQSLTNEHLKLKIIELEKYIDAQQKVIDQLNKELALKDEKLAQMEALLVKNVPSIVQKDNRIQLEIAPAEQIYEFQVKRLLDASKVRDLTVDEARKLELFEKIKKPYEKERKSKNEIDVTDSVKKLSADELRQIVGEVEKTQSLTDQDEDSE